jgi:hypothetical protein
MACLFVSTGCDYISYFKHLGKSTFLNTFFQHASFINEIQSLSEITEGSRELGFLAFLRLIGTVYFKKHLASFISIHNVNTPVQLFNSIEPSLSLQDRHKKFLQLIRSVNSDRITTEEERTPSLTALWRHWLRATYVCKLWSNAHLSDIYSNMPLPENSGWISQDNKYYIDWEDAEVQENITQNINYLLNGCNCKSGCTTSRCGCVKKSITCGPGCNCSGCKNIPVHEDDKND